MNREPLSQAGFGKLPLLLTYSQVLACGVSRYFLKRYVETGRITFVQLRGQTRRRYRKADVAKLLGL